MKGRYVIYLKRIQSNDNKDDPKSQEKNEGTDLEDTRNIYQGATRCKEQTNRDGQYNN